MSCYNPGDFKKYFNENMEALGLTVPGGLFETKEKAIGTTVLILGALEKFGKGATIGELIGATTGLEKLAVVAALGAAGFVGAVIGSIAVATGRALSCGSRISDMFVFFEQNPTLKFKNWHAFYLHNPQILDKNSKFRKTFGVRCKDRACTFQYS